MPRRRLAQAMQPCALRLPMARCTQVEKPEGLWHETEVATTQTRSLPFHFELSQPCPPQDLHHLLLESRVQQNTAALAVEDTSNQSKIS